MTSTIARRSLRPISERSRFFVLVGGWAIASALLFYGAHAFRYVMSNIDGIQYIRIAEDYAAGRLGDAINAYWSPMVSWSMLPFMAMGIDSQYAFFLASAAWASIGVGIGTWFVWHRSGHSFVGSAVTLIFLYVLCGSNLVNLTPDLLVVTWTVGFAWVLVEVNDRLSVGTVLNRVRWGILLGAVMAIGYFVKAFDVPVFIVVGLGWLGVRMLAVRSSRHESDESDDAKPQRWRDRVRPMLVVPAAALIALVLISAPFVTALSVKYGGFTVGSSFEVNFSSQKFGDTSHKEDLTKDSLQLPPPPNASAISFGEDRTAQLSLPSDDAAAAATAHQPITAKLGYYLEQRVAALPVYLHAIEAISPFTLPIVAVVFVLFALRFLDPRRWRSVAITLSVFVVYFLGYGAIVGSTGGNLRYYWPLSALATIIAGLLWPALWSRARRFGGWWRPALAVALAIVLIAQIPLVAVIQLGLLHHNPSAGESSLGYLRPGHQKFLDESYDEKLAHRLLDTGIIEPHSRIVGSNNEQRKALIIAFYMRAGTIQVYGRTEPHDINDPRFQAVMRENGIDYYFDFEPKNQPALDVSAWGVVKKEIIMPETCGTYGGKTEDCRLTIVSVNP